MKPSTVQIFCGVTLAAISAAGLSHWWSVKEFIALVNSGTPITAQPQQVANLSHVETAPQAPTRQTSIPMVQQPVQTATVSDPAQKKFYETLVEKMERLQNQNRDLLDQMAETNRDLMKLEFRVDTHSESFRPLPVNEERNDTSFDDSPGVLPPRAEPVYPSFDE